MSYSPPTIELVHGDGEPQHAIIWLHGLGASSSDFPPVVPELGLSPDRAIRFVFPQAPNRPITINAGVVMPGWYDIKGVDIAAKQDAEGMAEARDILEGFIKSENERGIAIENIIVAGFSQGGAVAYHTAVRFEQKLAGVLALSTYLPFADDVATEQSGSNKDTPIFTNHGTFDPVVPMHLGKMSADILIQLGYQLEWREYPMQHQVVLEQLQDIGAWINATFS